MIAAPFWDQGAAIDHLCKAIGLDHVYLQLQAAVDGLGIALGSLPLIEADIAAGRLICPLPAPEWPADDYQLLIRQDRLRDPAIKAFRNWILTEAAKPLAGIEKPSRQDRATGRKG